MSAIDTKWKNTAYKTLQKKGKSITLRQVTEGAFDPNTGEVAKTTNDISLKARVGTYKAKTDNLAYQQGDIEVIMPTTSDGSSLFEIDKSDRLVIDSDEHYIVDEAGSIEKIYAQNEPVLYKVVVRKV